MLGSRKIIAPRAARSLQASTAAPIVPTPSVAVAASAGGQPAAGTSEASATITGQSIVAMVSALATMWVEPPTIQVVHGGADGGEDAVVTHVAGAARSVATPPPQTGVWALGARQMEGDMSVVSPGAVAIGQGPMPITLALDGVRETTPAERPQSEEVVSLGTSLEPPRALMRLGTGLLWLEWADL